MNQTAPTGQPKAKNTLPTGWFVGLAVLLLLIIVSQLLDNTTELVPNHDRVQEACLEIAALCGVVCVGLFIRVSKNLTTARRVLLAPLVWVIVFIAVFVTTAVSAQIVEGLIDFPPGKTKTYYKVLLPISRAYHTHGRHESWDIQTTTPGWADFNITRDDYQLMLAHRRPGDEGRNQDEISSRDYFCARVTVQATANALRVMHAGNRTLPAGTVVLCPSLAK